MSKFTDASYFRRHSWIEYVFIFAVCFGQLLTQIATTEAMMQMYSLQSDFKAPSSMLALFSSTLGLAVGTLILIAGRLGDVYGIKKMLVGGYAWTTLWSLLCGISYYSSHLGPSFYLCCRAFQGCGLAFILPNVLGAAGRVYSPHTFRKRLIFALVGLCTPVGGFLGVWWSGIIGVRTERWDWNYYAYSIVCAILGVITFFSVPAIPTHRNKDGSRQDPDWIGMFLLAVSMTLVNFCWNYAPVVGWQKAYIIVLFVIGMVSIAVLAVWEICFARNPLVPKVVWTNVKLMSILFTLFLSWGTYGINVFNTQSLYQDYRKYSTFAAGSAFAVIVPLGVAAAVSGALLINHKTVELLLFAAMLCFLATSIILATTPIHQSYWLQTFGAWIVAPFGMDWSAPTASVMLSEQLPPQYQALAGSLGTVAVNYGMSIFLGMVELVESQLTLQRPDDGVRAYRGGEYLAVGLSGLSAVIAFFFVLNKFVFGTPPPKDEEEQIDVYPQEPEDKAPRTDEDDPTAKGAKEERRDQNIPYGSGSEKDSGDGKRITPSWDRDSISSLSVSM